MAGWTMCRYQRRETSQCLCYKSCGKVMCCLQILNHLDLKYCNRHDKAAHHKHNLEKMQKGDQKYARVKRVVHPNMKILSLFASWSSFSHNDSFKRLLQYHRDLKATKNYKKSLLFSMSWLIHTNQTNILVTIYWFSTFSLLFQDVLLFLLVIKSKLIFICV